MVQVPRPFRAGHLCYWTLQGQPAIVQSAPDSDHHFFVESDLLLCSGQKLACVTTIHDVDVIHDRLAALWSPRWNRHVEVSHDKWRDICVFASAHLPCSEISLPPVTVELWRKALSSFKPNAATGPCGWTLADLKHMTDQQISALLDFFAEIEGGGSWPKQWNVGLIHLLQKKDSCTSVDAFRPITVISLFYRVYSGLRAGQLLCALSELSASMQCGFLRGRQAADVWYFVQTCIEVAIQQDTPVHGLVADLVKAYNTLPRFPVFFVLQHIGVPRRFLSVWTSYLSDFERYFVVHRVASPVQRATTGFPEGCPLSCVAMAAVDLLWHVFQSRAVPRSCPVSFVDNLEVVCDSVADLESSHTALTTFCTLLDLDLDLDSFVVWSSSDAGRRALRNKGYTISLGQRDLGGQVIYCKQLRNRVLQDRIEATFPFFTKVSRSSLAMAARSANVRQVLFPRALHGCEAVQLGDQHIQRLRTAVMKAMKWSRAGASPLVRLGLLHSELDPGWYQFWRTVSMFRHQLSQNPAIRDWWVIFATGYRAATHGPFSKFQDLLEDLGLRVDEHLQLHFSEQGKIDLCQCSESFLKDFLLHWYRLRLTRVIQERQGYAGLEGFDYALTCSNDGSFPSEVREQLMIVRDGSFFTDATKSKWDATTASFCQWCQQKDTKLHRYTVCSKYDHVRANHAELFQEWDELPECFQVSGLVPQNPWQSLLWEALQHQPDRLRDFQLQPTGHLWHAFTDGTCSHPQQKTRSLAAWAVVDPDRGVIASGPLCGPQQCILRAEVTAVLSAVLWVKDVQGQLHIWTDSQIVVDAFRAIQQGFATAADYEHSDLWQDIQDHLKYCTDVLIHKVYSHDMPSSPLEDFCRKGNASANTQAEVANSMRPGWFMRVYDGFVSYQSVWLRRVKLYTAFVASIAQQDCVSQSDGADENCTEDHEHPVFETCPNDASLSHSLASLDGRTDLFEDGHPYHFQEVFHRLRRWLCDTDSGSATSRSVTLLEIYFAFRIFAFDGIHISGEQVIDRYSSVTVAADYSYFKRLLMWLLRVSGIDLSGSISLPEVNILLRVPTLKMGWPAAVAQQTFDMLSRFVHRRPITSTQSLARPWP
eukprot:Skav213360  [mRNA]  locus=scaffold317:292453:295758:+ [translate_table: standard]